MRNNLHRSSRQYRRARKAMFEMYGDVCHICRHPGAGEADHLETVASAPDQPISPHAMRPAHGTSARCPVCVGADGQGRACNQERGARPLATAPPRTSQEW